MSRTTDEALAATVVRTGVGPFPDAALERAYRRDYFELSIRTVRSAIGLAIALFVLFSLVDPYVVPGAEVALRSVRLGFVAPTLVAVLVWSYSRHFRDHLVAGQFLTVMIGGSALIFMGTLGDHVVADAQYVGLLLAVMWTHSVSRLPFAAATLATTFLTAGYLGVELILDRLTTTALLNNGLLLASAHLIGMIASYHLESGFRRDFQQRMLLDQRRRALEESIDSLHEAEGRVSELESRAPDSIENLPRWAEQIVREIRRTVNAAEVRVWRCADGEPVALTEGDLQPPSRDEVRAAGQMSTDALGNVIVPLSGLSGELFGVIVIASPANWGSPERRLVGGFARYLGGALEILEKRHELALEEARREGKRRRMQEQGVGAMRLCPTCGRCFDEGPERCDVDGTRLVPQLLPYRVQDRYQLVRLLGQGGMGQVFLARDERLQREVAIKVLHGETPLDSQTRAQLAHEARAVARIGHPGVVDIFDLGELDDGSAFIVMEYLSGRALSEVIARHGRGTPQQVASLLRQVAAALSAAHRTGVVHRDIKPQNVFLTRVADGFQVRLLDFGVARVAGAGTNRDSGRGGVLGTPAYMAPEQLGGAEGDERSDLWALAAVAFEALVGRRLMRPRGSMAELLASILSDPVPDVSSAVEGAPAELDSLFCAALSRDAARRPSSVTEWAENVARWLDAMPAGPGWPLPITHELTIRDDTPVPRVSALSPG
ncbi:MAG TPA: serine/threonine-protein kinase [Gemmatimonadaceae bacterium]